MCQSQNEEKKQRKTIKVISTRKFRYHSNSKKCSECGKVFSDKYIMITHKKTQHGIKPHACKKCSESFNSMKELKDHIRISHLNYGENDLSQIKEQQNPKNYPKKQKLEEDKVDAPKRDLRKRTSSRVKNQEEKSIGMMNYCEDTLSHSFEVSEDINVNSSSSTQVFIDQNFDNEKDCEEKQTKKKQKICQEEKKEQKSENFLFSEELTQKLLEIAQRVLNSDEDEEVQNGDLQCVQNSNNNNQSQEEQKTKICKNEILIQPSCFI